MSTDPTRTEHNANDRGTDSFAPRGDTASFVPNGAAGGRPEPLPEVPGYELTSVLGRGGMGVVYLARQLSTDRQVAVKMLPVDGGAGAAGPIRFRTEVEATARPAHPNIVQVFEAGEAGGRAYLVCEFVAGGSLATHIDGTPWPADRAARLLIPLARALATAHGAQIVHRDIKPSNILLTPDGTPKLADFGVAKRLGAETHTHTGAVLGTPSYMAPEQAGGAKTVGPAADVYGLGAVLYELLTGRPPFAGADFLDTLDQVRTRDPVPPRVLLPKLPRDIETICLKCLQKDPARRYASADELTDDLDRFLGGRPIVARPVGAAERAWKWVRRNRALSAAVAAVTLALVTGTAVATVFAVRAADSEARATQKATEAAADRDAARAAEDAARAAERESRRRMVWLKLMTATRSLEAGDPSAALLWFSQVWELDRSDASAEASHRARLAGLLQTMPDLIGACFHTDQVTDAVFSPDGTRVLARTEGNAAYIWDYEKSRLAAPLMTHTDRVRHLCWSPDGTAVATASADKTVAIWDAKTGARRHTLAHGGAVNWVAYHPKGDRLVTAAEDGTVRLWETASGKQLPWAFPAGAVVDYIAFSPDGSRLLTAGRDDAVRVWAFDPPAPLSPPLPYRASTPTERYQFHWDRWPKFSPDGKSVASFKGQNLVIWRDGDGEAKSFDLDYGITEVYFVPGTDRLLATGNKYNRVAVVTVADGKDVYVLQHPRQANVGGVSPDGKHLITASGGGVIHLWDAATGAPVWNPQRCGDFASAVAFSPDGKRCLAASQDGTIRVWAVAARPPSVHPYQPDGRAHYLTLPVPGGRERVTGPDGRAPVEYGGKDQPALATLAPGTAPVTVEHPEPVTAVLFSGDGARFVVFGGNTVRVWDAKTSKPAGEPVRLPASPQPPKEALAGATHDRLSRDGTRLAVWDDPKTVSVWDLGAGKRVFGPWRNDNPGPLVFGPKEHHGIVNGLVLSPDGRLLAGGTDSSGTLTVWNVDTGGVIHQNRRYRGYIQGFGFSADGQRILLWASDNTARVFESRTGTAVGPALRPAQTKAQYVRVNPNECAISDDGRRLAFFENISGMVRLWDADRADALLTVTVPERTAASRMWFSPDGTRVNLVVGGKALGVEVPRFDVPAELTGPLVRLLTGQRIDETDGIEFIDQFAFRTDPDTYRRAFLVWRGLADDPGAQPPRTPQPDRR